MGEGQLTLCNIGRRLVGIGRRRLVDVGRRCDDLLEFLNKSWRFHKEMLELTLKCTMSQMGSHWKKMMRDILRSNFKGFAEYQQGQRPALNNHP
jgi:hypothetical protein